LDLRPPCLDLILEGAQIWYASADLEAGSRPRLIIWSLRGGEYFRLCYADGTEFVVDRMGTEVWATWPSSLTLEDTAMYLLGPVISFALLLRGHLCLHASAIAVGDQAIAMLGPSGAGKSTAAAAFARSGYGVLTDDVVAVTNRGRDFLVQPAYPRIRLWPESVSALYGAEDALPCLTPTWDKRYLDLTGNGCRFQHEPLPLAAIYILDERRDDPKVPSVEAMPAAEGLIALVANTYATRLMDKKMRARDFESLGRIATGVPLRRAIPHTDLSRLSMLCDAILEDFHALVPSPTAPADSTQGCHV